MAQRKPEDPISELNDAFFEQALEPRPAIDEAFLEQLRNDPRVIVHRQSTTEPYVPKIVFTEPVDVLWLIGRRDKEWVDDEDPDASE